MKTEIVIKLPLIKRWILKAFIGGLLKNLDKSRVFYRDSEKHSKRLYVNLKGETVGGVSNKASDLSRNQMRGIEQSINAVRKYCGMNTRDFRIEEWIAEEDKKDIEKAGEKQVDDAYDKGFKDAMVKYRK